MKPSVHKVSIRDFLSYILLNSKTDHPRINKEIKNKVKIFIVEECLMHQKVELFMLHGNYTPHIWVEIIVYMGTIK